MLPPSEWLKPPRSLLLILFLVTLVSVTALVWFGWRVLYQEQLVDAQRGQQRLEETADRIAATAQLAITEAGEKVGNWLIAPPPDGQPETGLLLIATPGKFASYP